MEEFRIYVRSKSLKMLNLKRNKKVNKSTYIVHLYVFSYYPTESKNFSYIMTEYIV